MGMTLPGWLTEPLGWIGLTWPQADEEKLFNAGTTWINFATTLDPIATQAGATATSVWDNNENDVTEAFKTWWTSDMGPEKRLYEDMVAATVIGAACFMFAAVTLVLKIWFIVQLIILAYQVAAAIAAAFVSFGASTAAIPGFVALCRFACRKLVNKVVDLVQNAIKTILTKAKKLLKKVAQRRLGKKLARDANRRVMRSIENALRRTNPRFDPDDPNWSMNCTHCVQAYELRRRGFDVSATNLPQGFHPSPWWGGGRPLNHIENTWGRGFTSGSRRDIVNAFEDAGPGSRGVVSISWKDGGAHVFNVENVGGKIRFVDGQNNVVDVSKYFGNGFDLKYVRLDDLPFPPGVIPHFAS